MVLVAFFPDERLEHDLKRLLAQANALVVIDNTPQENRVWNIPDLHIENKRFQLIENRENLGIAAALNQGLEQAISWGCEWIITLDQDSRCHDDMVQTLSTAYHSSARKPVVVGGNYFDPRNKITKVPVEAAATCLEQKTVITSGSLIDAVFADSIGGFREDYFIDQLDHEFCLRARLHGGLVLITRKPVMEHSVGESGGIRFPLLGQLPNHPPLRKYYIARNSVVTMMAYWRHEPDWCLRRLLRLLLGAISMLLLESNGLVKIRAFAVGVSDGLRRRMGPCRHPWLFEK